MDDRWYYSHDENKIGPCSERQLKELASSGGILTTDTIWKEGVTKGVTASRVKNLFPSEIADAPRKSSPAVEGAPLPKPVPILVDSPPKCLPAVDGTTAGHPLARLANGATEAQAHEKTALSQPVAEQKKPPKGRAVGMKGVVIVSQDGEMVRYKKKCIKCGFTDACAHKAPIKGGIIRASFFCPDCRKTGEVVIQCTRKG